MANNKRSKKCQVLKKLLWYLNYPQKKETKAPVDWDSFVIPTERGQNVDEYMREMRENDRL